MNSSHPSAVKTRSRPLSRRWQAAAAGGLLLVLAGGGMWLREPANGDSAPHPTPEKSAVSLNTRPPVSAPAGRSAPVLAPGAKPRAAWVRALDEIAALTDPAERGERLRQWVEGVAERDLSAAIDLFREDDPSGLGAEMASGLLRRLTTLDPLAAGQSAEKMPPGAARSRALQDVAVMWVNRDARAATEWVRQWPDETERRAGLLTLGYEIARTQAGDALALAQELPEGRERDELLHHAAAQWAATEPVAAVSWARQLPEPKLRERLLGRIALEWADRDPASAATMVVRELPAGKGQRDAIIGIVQRWAQSNPQAAMAWVANFSPGVLRDTAVDNLAALLPAPAAN